MRAHRVLLVVFVLFVARPSPVQARSWNPLKAVAKKAKVVGRAIGDVLGVGGFVDSATAPTIRNVEDAGRRLVRDTEDALKRRVDHVGSVTSRLIAETNKGLADQLETVDRSMEARILQVKLGASETIDHTFGRLDRSLGRIDDLARRRIDQIGKTIGATGKDLIERADAKARGLLAEADQLLSKRMEEVHELVHTSIQEADEAAEARIAQLDELAGRRIKNLDVVATRLSLNLERAMVRIAALAALVGFIAFALWRLFAEAGTAWKTSLIGNIGGKVKDTAVRASPRFFTQLGLAAVGAGLLYFLAGHLPKNAEERAAQQIAQHERAVGAALAAYDFAGVKYHASQLEVLRTDETGRTRVLVRKADLLQTIFTRPALLQTAGGLRQVMADIAAIEREQAEPDPDLLVLQAYVLWQVGATRSDEYEAAALCADALELPPRDQPGGFMLGALAFNYLRAFLHDPYQPAEPGEVTGTDLDRLRRVHDRVSATRLATEESPQFQHVVEYNRLVAALDRASSAAYLEMLSAHADHVVARQGWKKPQPERPAMAEARERRLAAAQEVIAAWRTFDEQLETSPWLADDPTSLVAFTLDDAVLARALYFAVKPDALELPPEFLADEDPKAPEKLTAELRVKTAPLRIAWARRYATLIGSRTQDLLAFEETARFRAFETRAHAFEVAYTEFLVGARSPVAAGKDELAKKAEAAARAAARMGLHRDTRTGRITEAARIVEDLRAAGGDLSREAGADIAAAYEVRRLRFL
jgi:hypothetical protein